MNQDSKKKDDPDLSSFIMTAEMAGIDTSRIAKRWLETMNAQPNTGNKPGDLSNTYKTFFYGMKEMMLDYDVIVEVGREHYDGARPDEPILWTQTGFHIGKVEKGKKGEENFSEYAPDLHKPIVIVRNLLSELINAAIYYQGKIDEFYTPLRLLRRMSNDGQKQ
jgi:hypothetical protein